MCGYDLSGWRSWQAFEDSDHFRTLVVYQILLAMRPDFRHVQIPVAHDGRLYELGILALAGIDFDFEHFGQSGNHLFDLAGDDFHAVDVDHIGLARNRWSIPIESERPISPVRNQPSLSGDTSTVPSET